MRTKRVNRRDAEKLIAMRHREARELPPMLTLDDEPKKKTMRELFVDDCGRDGVAQVSVEEGDSFRVLEYTPADYTPSGRLRPRWWRANGYRGRLAITDMGKRYIIKV